MKGLILAAGYGTRLYPLTVDKPKPLLEVGAKTILERLLNKLDAVSSCDEVYIVTNDRFYGVIEAWNKEHSYRFPVRIINDKTTSNDDRLGAIGDINLVLETFKPADDILIMAGDNLFEFKIMDFVSFAVSKKMLTIALYDVKNKELAKKYGIVKIDGSNRIVSFEEKPAEPRSTLASTGIYYIPADKIKMFGEYIKCSEKKDAPGNFMKWVSEKDGAYGFAFADGWYDIGDIDSYKKADKEYHEKGM